jgi:hypothetical protein
LGVAFLVQVYGVVPSWLFLSVSVGWGLFVVDSVLTFVRPRISYYLAFALAVLAFVSSVPQTAHYAFIEQGLLLPSATFLLGSAVQVLLIVVVPYHLLKTRRREG